MRLRGGLAVAGLAAAVTATQAFAVAGALVQRDVIPASPRTPGFGSGVSLSADGSTLLVGSHYGGTTLFVRAGAAWKRAAHFGGLGFALSSSGKVAAVSNDRGSQTVLYRRASTGWHIVRRFAGEVASLSATGDVVALTRGFGAVDLYRQTNAGWVGDGRVTGDGATGFGAPAQLSANGRILLVGDAGAGGAPGMLYVYRQFPRGWARTAAFREPAGGSAHDGFGYDASISPRGTAILTSDQQGRNVYPFTYVNGRWTRGATITFGRGVGEIALTEDGNGAVVSDFSAVGHTAGVLYKRRAGHWQAIMHLRGSGPNGNSGYQEAVRAAVDATGTTVALGASTIMTTRGADKNFVDVFATP